jgi:hypothetical protein
MTSPPDRWCCTSTRQISRFRAPSFDDGSHRDRINFGHEIETKDVPELIVQPNDAAQARDAWLGTATSNRRGARAGHYLGRKWRSYSLGSWLTAARIAVGAGSAALVTAPVPPGCAPDGRARNHPAARFRAPSGCSIGATARRPFRRSDCTTCYAFERRERFPRGATKP